MGILLAFAPFIVFAVVDRITGPMAALAAGAAVSAALIGRDLAGPRRTVKVLEAGTFVLFAGLALYTLLNGADWSVIGVRLCVDAGLLLIVLASMAVGRPFTLQYARDQVAPEFWQRPEFIRTNYVITGAWALAFAVMVLAELALLYLPDLPRRAGIVAIVLALIGAVKFTGWYPERAGSARPADPRPPHNAIERATMSSFIREAIGFTIANYAVTFVCAGLLSALLSVTLGRRRASNRGDVIEALLGWHVFWSIGVSYLVNFVFHAFFGGLAARFIGWADSPFQFEVATASLGFAAVGFLAAWRSFDLRLAAVLGPALFTLGAAAGHVYQMVTAHNFAPGNAGPIFYADIVVPLFGFALLWCARGRGADRLAGLVGNLSQVSPLSRPAHQGGDLR